VPPNLPTIQLRAGADQRVRLGHLWIFSNELRSGFQSLEAGTVVEIMDARGRFIGIGTVNPHSLIAVRLFTREREMIDRTFLLNRLRAAVALRRRIWGGEEAACRLVYSEADGLPGLIIDKFANVLVVQSSTAGMDRLLPLIFECLAELVPVRAMVAACDSPMREFEGLRLYREVVNGSLDAPVPIMQDGITFLADCVGGQKTGFFLDQRANRRLLLQFISQESRVLDLFCYTGAFGLYALAAGASYVHFVDASECSLAIAQEAVALNGWQDHSEFRKADIFPFLKEYDQRYDVVILDPPALAKSRMKVPAALRAYRDLNARAIALVEPGGLLATSSCSGLVHAPAWREALQQAAAKTGRKLRILATGSQAPDHPLLAAMPETEYLKFVLALVD
jgi:23S rRNA (cytosine1962-C5)-methyltransferase